MDSTLLKAKMLQLIENSIQKKVAEVNVSRMRLCYDAAWLELTYLSNNFKICSFTIVMPNYIVA